MGASRVRKAIDLYHYGLIRRSDWLPVGGNPLEEHITRSVDSLSDSETQDSDSTDTTENEETDSRYTQSEYAESTDASCDNESSNEDFSDDESFQTLLDSLPSDDSYKDEWNILFQE